MIHHKKQTSHSAAHRSASSLVGASCIASTSASCAVLLMVSPNTDCIVLLKFARLLLMAVEGSSRRGDAYTKTS
jgi:hypothetical protein